MCVRGKQRLTQKFSHSIMRSFVHTNFSIHSLCFFALFCAIFFQHFHHCFTVFGFCFDLWRALLLVFTSAQVVALNKYVARRNQ